MDVRCRLSFVAVLAATAACSSEPDPTTTISVAGTGGAGGLGTGGLGTGGLGAGGLGGTGGVAAVGGQGGDGGGGCVNSLATDLEPPELLSETGLYKDIAGKELASIARPFAPQFRLWSDAADKERWVYLPECGPIDTSDMNDWALPVGTRLWKQFSVDGARIETRLIERTGEGAHDFIFAAYLWNEAETEAQRVPDGQPNAKGTTHDVPNEDACFRCHGSHEKGGGRPSRALGLSAIQLSHDGDGLTLSELIDEGALSAPPTESFTAPGSDVERTALGYLHANCGHCHNDTPDGVPQIDMNLWLDVEQTSVETTSAYLTAVGQPNAIFNDQHVTARIEPGDPEKSAVFYRMNERGNNAQMPPVGTEVTDAAGIAAVETWIEGMQ